MEDLRGELRRLGFKPGRANVSMAIGIRREVIVEPDRVKRLETIARAYNAGKIDLRQARMLTEDV